MLRGPRTVTDRCKRHRPPVEEPGEVRPPPRRARRTPLDDEVQHVAIHRGWTAGATPAIRRFEVAPYLRELGTGEEQKPPAFFPAREEHVEEFAVLAREELLA